MIFHTNLASKTSNLNFSKSAFLLGLALSGISIPCQSQNAEEVKQVERAKRTQLLTEKMLQVVELPQIPRSVDDTIFALATGSQTNFFCDVTEVSNTSLIQSFPGTALTKAAVEREPLKWKSNLWLQLGDMMEQSGMTHLHTAPGTILMWHPPEYLQLSREIIGDWKRRQRSLTSPEMSYSELRRAWRDYFAEKGWDGGVNDGDLKVKLADLPQQAQQLVLSEAWKKLFWNSEWSCFDDQLWTQSRVLVDESFRREGEKVEPYLHLVQDNEATGETRLSSVAIGPISFAVEIDPATTVATAPELLTPLVLPNFDRIKGSPRVQPLSEAALRADPSLTKKVGVETRRGSLPEVLRALSQQGGTTIRSGLSAEDYLSTRLLTIKTAELSLCDTMLELSDLTGAVWTHETEAYVLHDNHESTLNFHLRQIGDPKVYRVREGTALKMREKYRRNTAVMEEVLKAAKLVELQKPEGVRISSLSQNLQNQLRRLAQEEAARSLPVKAVMARELLEVDEEDNRKDGPDQGLVLLLRQEKDPKNFQTIWFPHNAPSTYALRSVRMSLGPDLTLTLRQPDGQLVASLFDFIRWVDPPQKKP